MRSSRKLKDSESPMSESTEEGEMTVELADLMKMFSAMGDDGPEPEPKKKDPMERIMGAMQTGADFETRTIYLVGEINDGVSFRFLVAFRIMDETDGPIKIVMNSVGGHETDGYAIYDAIRLSRNEVTIEVYGACQSIAAAIMQAGDKRLMAPEASFMVHNGSMRMDGVTEQDYVIRIANHLTEECEHYYRILASGSKLSMKEIAELCKEETFLDAKETVRYKLADSVIRRSKKCSPRKSRR